MIRFAVALLFVLGAVVQADEIEEKAKAVTDKTQQRMETVAGQIESAKDRLKLMKKATVNTKLSQPVIPDDEKAIAEKKKAKKPIAKSYIYQSKDAKEKAVSGTETMIAKLETELTELKEGKIYFGYLTLPPKLGFFGELERKVRIVQVIGPNKMLVEAFYYNLEWKSNNGEPFLSNEEYKVILMVKNVSTKGIVDKSLVDLSQIMEVTDTETYETKLGSNTVFVIEPMDTKKIEETLKSK